MFLWRVQYSIDVEAASNAWNADYCNRWSRSVVYRSVCFAGRRYVTNRQADWLTHHATELSIAMGRISCIRCGLKLRIRPNSQRDKTLERQPWRQRQLFVVSRRRNRLTASFKSTKWDFHRVHFASQFLHEYLQLVQQSFIPQHESWTSLHKVYVTGTIKQLSTQTFIYAALYL